MPLSARCWCLSVQYLVHAGFRRVLDHPERPDPDRLHAGWRFRSSSPCAPACGSACHDALFRLRRQHGARRDGEALPGRAAARAGAVARLALRDRDRATARSRLRPGSHVFGVLWRLTPRDLAALNAFESLDSGLYRRTMLTVEIGGQRARALVYVGEQARQAPADARLSGTRRRRRRGLEAAIALCCRAARLAPGYRAARPAETGEIG